MRKEDKPRLFPEHFKIGKYSGSPRDFTKGKISFPRGGEDVLEYWYTDDPEESEYLDEDFQENIENKITRLKNEGWDPSKQVFLATTNSHLDLGWMWRFRQGVGKAERTMAKVHRHFKLFEPFTFSNSQPAQYQWVKLNSPEIWDMILEDVKSGRHEIQGGCWSEADGRMPSGEAWVRQRLFGQLFYARNFGKIANIGWFPDSFGYANNMPQIFAKSGADGFMTGKLVNNKQTKWPFWAWWWEGPDGSKLISYLSGNHNKLGPLGGYDVPQRGYEVRESYVKSFRLLKPGTTLTGNYEIDMIEVHENVSDEELPFIGCIFGEGDGGHGPQGVEMAVYRGFAERGYVKWKSTKEIYEELALFGERLPVWKDELYYEYHRGSLTTQTLMKRMNRFFEWNLPAVEALCAIVETLSPGALESIKNYNQGPMDQMPTTENPLEQIWYNTLLMQFHDVLPGTSIPEVYDECYEFWHQDRPLLEQIRSDALKALSSLLLADDPGITIKQVNIQGKDYTFIPLLLANSTGSSGTQLVEIPKEKFKEKTPLFVLDYSGEEVKIPTPVQLIAPKPLGHEFDLKSDHYVFSHEFKSWSSQFVWIVATETEDKEGVSQEEISKKQSNLLPPIRDSKYSILDGDEAYILNSPDISLKIDKETGSLKSIRYQNGELLKSPAGMHYYLDEGTTEPAWNLMPNWWEHELTAKLVSPSTCKIVENGPVRWTVRVSRNIGENTKEIVDYSIVRDKAGFGVEIGLDFHETDTLAKFNLPFNLQATHTIAETPYATSKRRINPTANRDIPRWEQWMHTFVTLEDREQQLGVAVINEGKYGFDSLEGSIGISIVHGPIYPGTNPVAWARDERKEREKQGLGQPPKYADQGQHITRLCILPYQECWQQGHIHHTAHFFNTPISTHLHNTDEIENEVIKIQDYLPLSQLWDALKEGLPSLSSKNITPMITSSNPSIEIPVIKIAETLPACLIGDNNSTNSKAGIIFRVVNNRDSLNKAEITVDGLLLKKSTKLVEIDLLEREIAGGKTLDFEQKSEKIKVALNFKPHEIKSFKLL